MFIPGPNPWHAWRGHCPPYTDELLWPFAVTLTGSVFGWPSNAKYGCVSSRRAAADQGAEATLASSRRPAERGAEDRRVQIAGRKVRGASDGRARREASVRGRDEARREEGRVQVERASSVRTEHVKRRSTVESQSQSQNVIRDARRHRASVRHRSVDQGEQAARAIGGLEW